MKYHTADGKGNPIESFPARGTWIEIFKIYDPELGRKVVPREGNVD